MLMLKPGSRFTSTCCTTEVVIVKGTAEVDLRCGGSAMVATGDHADPTELAAGYDGGTLAGKRYADADDTVEVLCTKPGDGSLSIGDALLAAKGAKALPASD